MRERYVAFDGRTFRVFERPAVPVERGWMLVKPLYVYVGFPERLLYSGLEPVEVPRRIGSSCVAKVIESQGPELSGRLVVTKHLLSGRLVGLDVDGCLSTYAGVPGDLVFWLPDRAEPHYALLPFVQHALDIAGEAYGNVLVIGCNLVGLLAALAMRDSGMEPTVYCARGIGPARRLGLRATPKAGDLAGSYDVVAVVEAQEGWALSALAGIRYSRLVISALARPGRIPLPASGRAEVVVLDDVEARGGEKLWKHCGTARELVRVVRVRDPEEALGLLPPGGLGYVVELGE
ncbi:MAG: hypothetical protein ABWK00_00485 [Desulfurococcaceae archaeon]